MAEKKQLYTKTAHVSRKLILVYRSSIIVNGCYWNTCKLVFTKTHTRVPVSMWTEPSWSTWLARSCLISKLRSPHANKLDKDWTVQLLSDYYNCLNSIVGGSETVEGVDQFNYVRSLIDSLPTVSWILEGRLPWPELPCNSVTSRPRTVIYPSPSSNIGSLSTYHYCCFANMTTSKLTHILH